MGTRTFLNTFRTWTLRWIIYKNLVTTRVSISMFYRVGAHKFLKNLGAIWKLQAPEKMIWSKLFCEGLQILSATVQNSVARATRRLRLLHWTGLECTTGRNELVNIWTSLVRIPTPYYAVKGLETELYRILWWEEDRQRASETSNAYIILFGKPLKKNAACNTSQKMEGHNWIGISMATGLIFHRICVMGGLLWTFKGPIKSTVFCNESGNS